MLMGWTGWALFSLGMAAEAFVSGPSLHSTTIVSRTGAAGWSNQKRQIQRPATMQAPSMAEGQATSQQQTLSAGVELEEISGKRLCIEFAAFGFFKRFCQLELVPNGDCKFGKGMVANLGAWRVEEEDGTEYLQFSCPLIELYSEIFEIPSSLLFWRVPLRKGADGSIVLEGGQIISERSALFGLRKDFLEEGTFKARVLADDEEFPIPDAIDVSDIEVPAGLSPRKKKRSKEVSGEVNLTEQVAVPPLPSDLTGQK